MGIDYKHCCRSFHNSYNVKVVINYKYYLHLILFELLQIPLTFQEYMQTIYQIYNKHKEYFPIALENPSVPQEDKNKIKELLKNHGTLT